MTATATHQNEPAPVEPGATPLERFAQLPAWLRWSATAALGVLVLAIVQSVSGTELLTAEDTSAKMLRWSIPILLAGLGGLFSERAGVVNIGLEGMMILGTWAGAWGALEWGMWGGLLAGLAFGALGGLLHAIATVTFGVDQIVSGVAINILAPGLARYLSERVFVGEVGGSVSQSPRVDGFPSFTIPGVADALGWLRDQDIFWISDMAGMTRGFVAGVSWFTLFGVLCVPLTMWILWRTRFGLRLRICGENPQAGASLGVGIYGHKYAGVVISGALSGMAGAFIVLELAGLYRGGQTVGRGFIGLAALIFGNWRALGVWAGAMLFSYPGGLALADFNAEGSGEATRALLLVIAIALAAVAVWAWRAEKRTDMILAAVMAVISLAWYLLTERAASWLPNTMPYVVVLIVLVFASQRLRPPRSAGIPYRAGES